MVSQKAKKEMSQFITDRLEESQRYDVLERDNFHILVAQKPELVESPSQIYVVLHNRKMPLSEYRRLVAGNASNGVLTGNVFYKDGKMFKVHLGWRSRFKGDARSLKRYAKKDEQGNDIRDKIVHLRDLEKAVLDAQPGSNVLVYYQPETARLDEALRGYAMRTVELDYSHVTRDHPAYGRVSNGPSRDYKIADEIFNIQNGGVVFRGAGGDRCLVVSPLEQA